MRAKADADDSMDMVSSDSVGLLSGGDPKLGENWLAHGERYWLCDGGVDGTTSLEPCLDTYSYWMHRVGFNNTMHALRRTCM